MAFDPFQEIITDLHKKMEKIQSPGPFICIIDERGEMKYMDEGLKVRLDYINDFVQKNFDIIETGQYSFPISGTLLGFFKMSSKLMFVLYREEGKIGNLLLYRGLLENYINKIENLNSDLQTIEIWEKNANLILKLRKKGAAGGVAAGIRAIAARLGTEDTTPSAETEAGSAPAPKSSGDSSAAGLEIYPELQEKFRNKKFNFKEGLVMQYCNGRMTVEEIAVKTKLTEEDVLEVVNFYQKKGWLIINT